MLATLRPFLTEPFLLSLVEAFVAFALTTAPSNSVPVLASLLPCHPQLELWGDSLDGAKRFFSSPFPQPLSSMSYS